MDVNTYGVYAGLGGVGGLLVAAALILFVIARAKGQSLSRRRIFKPLRPFLTAPSSSAPVVAAARPVPDYSYASGETRPEPARDLLLLPKYIKYPALGHPALDELVENLGAAARGTVDEAVERAAHLVRHEPGTTPRVPRLLAGFWHDTILIAEVQ